MSLPQKRQYGVFMNKIFSFETVINPQVSTERLLLFNFSINDLFLLLYFWQFADDNNLYAISNNKIESQKLFIANFETATDWFHENFMILYPGTQRAIKCLKLTIETVEEGVKYAQS